MRLLPGAEESWQLNAETDGDWRLHSDTKGAQWIQTAEHDAAVDGQIWLQDPED